MIPIRFTRTETETIFHYKYSDLKYFVETGKEYGDAGFILTKRRGSLLTYRGFGTIDNPCYYINTISMVHFDLLDGKMPTDEQRLIPPDYTFNKGNYTFMIIDMSKIDDIKNYERT